MCSTTTRDRVEKACGFGAKGRGNTCAAIISLERNSITIDPIMSKMGTQVLNKRDKRTLPMTVPPKNFKRLSEILRRRYYWVKGTTYIFFVETKNLITGKVSYSNPVKFTTAVSDAYKIAPREESTRGSVFHTITSTNVIVRWDHPSTFGGAAPTDITYEIYYRVGANRGLLICSENEKLEQATKLSTGLKDNATTLEVTLTKLTQNTAYLLVIMTKNIHFPNLFACSPPHQFTTKASDSR